MWLWLVATAKRDATSAAIEERRRAWVAEGKARQLAARCRFAQRYLVERHSPARVFWLLETDDRGAVELITGHFGGLWDIAVHDVTPQAIGPAA